MKRRTFIKAAAVTAVLPGVEGRLPATAAPANPIPPGVVGQPLPRVDGPAKVRGLARYAYEQPVHEPLYLYPVTSTTTRGKVTAIDTSRARAVHRSVQVITHETAARLPQAAGPDLLILQDPAIAYHGQFLAAVVADTPEIAKQAADLVTVTCETADHDTELRPDHPARYKPGPLNGGYPPDSAEGDVETALRTAAVTLDQTYSAPGYHHVPMEAATTTAIWTTAGGVDHLTLYDSNQGAAFLRSMLAPALGLAPDQVDVISPFVGGAFGAKTLPRPHHILASLAAKAAPGRPVKLALARRHTFAGTGYRAPAFQRVRLGARHDGVLTAISHDVVQQTSRYSDFGEQTAVQTRMLYAGANRSTTHRLVPLDVSMPSVMRAPGEGPGSFAFESAMDELAEKIGIDPIELRVRNEPKVDPESGRPFSSRLLVPALREGARRFGWASRNPEPRARLKDGWWHGTGVAAASYPRPPFPQSSASVRALGEGRYEVGVSAADIGTGAWTILAQVAADALQVRVADVNLQIGSSAQPFAMPAAGSGGTMFWSDAIIGAVEEFRKQHGRTPPTGATTTATPAKDPEQDRYSMHAFGAQFAEVRINADTGEIRVSRMLGVFDVGRIINPRTARSQLIGGMTMGLSMALHEESVMDNRYGHVMTQDLASYHFAANADVEHIEAAWLGEPDTHQNRLGAKGLGEIGLVGAAAAIANAAWHATGIRVRALPLTLDKFLP
ncbi:xanthine dehydrogenase family protein molybdopterin-binding subunit [Saccharopolyspora sp. K220]|uniref:xanthine dehydrogenase family protein molybdopterin-binding subunit n=1 Tax=Saccharopolyspora soli TaxID=2926618 RepID=UPI001F57FC6E|nr:xanthine dehydrogenase family protein molybdopterin-binding subunit [Saccharopolyspora soli]MCI2423283.1 xanthine dehydrogenase family protein molybdopterin-binding subunit [Saccharopolyspora soli]